MQINRMIRRVSTGYLAVACLALFAGRLSAADKSAIDTSIKDILKASKKANVDTDFKPLVDRLLNVADNAIDDNNYVDATRAMAMAADFARKSGNIQMTHRVSQKSEEVKTLSKEFKLLSPALRKLASDDNDALANRSVGLFQCLGHGHWEDGVALLEKTNDDALKAIGQKELAPPMAPSDQVALAREWQAIAASDNGWMQQQMLKRAHYWAAKAYRSSPAGAERDKVFELLNSLPIMYLTDMNEILVNAGPWGFGKYGDDGVQRQINGIKGAIEVDGVNYSLGLGVHPPNNGSFIVRYKLNGDFKTLQLGCGLCDAPAEFAGTIVFSVAGDSRQLWSSEVFKKRRDAQFGSINVKGVQTLELRCEAKGDSTGGRGVWLDPLLTSVCPDM